MNAIVSQLVEHLRTLSLEDQVVLLNETNRALSDAGPFSKHPVASAQWIRATDVSANEYNPNTVATPEMKLLATSLKIDGFTQPVVITHDQDRVVQVDGFHRTSLVRDDPEVTALTHGYVPAVQSKQVSTEDHMASTVRHNRARGKHSVEIMSKIIQDLARRGWNDKRISVEFGMGPEEILRLRQTLGLAELYQDGAFSFSWEPVGDEETV